MEQSAARTALWPWRSRSSTMRNQVDKGSLLFSVRPISSPSRHCLAGSVVAILCSREVILYHQRQYPFHFHVALQNAGLPTGIASYPLKHVFLTSANGFVASH